jgi:hypothetical protein
VQQWRSRTANFRFSKLGEAKFRHLVRCFALDLTATQTAQLPASSQQERPQQIERESLGFRRLEPAFIRLCCINSVGRSSSVARFTSVSDIEDVEQLVYEAHLVFDMRLTREAMFSADHPHHLEPLHRRGGPLHCLKTSRRANDSLQCAVVGFNDVVRNQ